MPPNPKEIESKVHGQWAQMLKRGNGGESYERSQCATISAHTTFNRFVLYNVWAEARLWILLTGRKKV